MKTFDMVSQKTTKFHHGNLRSALIDAATKLLDQEGDKGVTIRAVARAAGVSHAAPANHFHDRKALMTSLAAQFFEDLHIYIIEALKPKSGSAEDSIFSFADALINYGLHYPERYQLLWRQDLLNDDDPALQKAMDGLYSHFTETIASFHTPVDYDLDTVSVALWSMCHGYVLMRLGGTFVPMQDKRTQTPRHKAIISSYLKSLN